MLVAGRNGPVQEDCHRSGGTRHAAGEVHSVHGDCDEAGLRRQERFMCVNPDRRKFVECPERHFVSERYRLAVRILPSPVRDGMATMPGAALCPDGAACGSAQDLSR